MPLELKFIFGFSFLKARKNTFNTEINICFLNRNVWNPRLV